MCFGNTIAVHGQVYKCGFCRVNQRQAVRCGACRTRHGHDGVTMQEIAVQYTAAFVQSTPSPSAETGPGGWRNKRGTTSQNSVVDPISRPCFRMYYPGHEQELADSQQELDENGVAFHIPLNIHDPDAWDDTALVEAYEAAVRTFETREEYKRNRAKRSGHDASTSLRYKGIVWKVGDECRAIFSDDGYAYDAVIDTVDAKNDGITVTYSEYKNVEVVHVNDVYRIPKSEKGYECGTIAEARYSEDGEWYDCIVDVANEDERSYVVTYMPYGNFERVVGSNIRMPRKPASGDERKASGANGMTPSAHSTTNAEGSRAVNSRPSKSSNTLSAGTYVKPSENKPTNTASAKSNQTIAPNSALGEQAASNKANLPFDPASIPPPPAHEYIPASARAQAASDAPLSHTPRLPTQGQDGNSGTQERAQTMPHCHVNGSPYSLAPQHRHTGASGSPAHTRHSHSYSYGHGHGHGHIPPLHPYPPAYPGAEDPHGYHERYSPYLGYPPYPYPYSWPYAPAVPPPPPPPPGASPWRAPAWSNGNHACPECDAKTNYSQYRVSGKSYSPWNAALPEPSRPGQQPPYLPHPDDMCDIAENNSAYEGIPRMPKLPPHTDDDLAELLMTWYHCGFLTGKAAAQRKGQHDAPTPDQSIFHEY